MNSIIKKLAFCALLGASIGADAAPVLITNGDFSTPGGSDYGQFQSPGTVVSYPSSGGNGGGYGLIDNTAGSWGGGLVSPPDNFYPGNQGTPLANLGLLAGKTYTFSMDMKNFAGSGKGGLKLEAWNGGGGAFNATADMPATGSSNQWANYTWNYTIPTGTLSIKVVPLLTTGSGATNADSVGFDNIRVNNTPVPVVPDQIPNGGFEIPNGASWGTVQGTPQFPTTGGNPNGNAILDGTGGFAVLYAFSNTEKTFASLGLAPGDSYKVQMDMKITNGGTNIGGLRLEGPSGYVIEAYPTKIGDGTQWATYSINLTVPASPTQSKFGLRPGAGSIVAFDNVQIVLPTPAAAPQPAITIGRIVGWTPTVTTNIYQPQESANGSVYTNLGSAFTGTAVTSTFDPTPAAFYRVQEGVPSVEEAALNGSFESEFLGAPESWSLEQSQPPVLINTNPHTGVNSMQIKVVNLMTGASPNGSELQQNIFNAGGSITPGKTYNFSFWAKQISSGPSYEQRFKISWLASGGAVISDGGFQGFSGVVGVWEKKTQNGLVAPVGAETALIQILGVTGAVDGGSGEVIVDDVSLQTTGIGSTTIIASTVTPSAEIRWQSIAGQSYQVRSSIDLSGWSPFGGVVAGNNTVIKLYDTPLVTRKFYQLGTQ